MDATDVVSDVDVMVAVVLTAGDTNACLYIVSGDAFTHCPTPVCADIMLVDNGKDALIVIGGVTVVTVILSVSMVSAQSATASVVPLTLCSSIIPNAFPVP